MRHNNYRTPPPLDPSARHRLITIIARVGERRAVEVLATPRSTLARAAAGFPIRRATADVLFARIEAAEDAWRRERLGPASTEGV